NNALTGALAQKEAQSKLAEQRARDLAQKEREARITLSTFLLDKGLGLCEQGDVDLGLLWLARSLENAPPDPGDLQRVIRINLAAWRPLAPQLRAFVPLGEDAEAVFGPDGETVVAWFRSRPGDVKREARVFDASTGKQIGTPFGGPLPTPNPLGGGHVP